jgi:hypothetical protein
MARSFAQNAGHHYRLSFLSPKKTAKAMQRGTRSHALPNTIDIKGIGFKSPTLASQ